MRDGRRLPAAAVALAAISLAAFAALTIAGIVSTSPVYDETTHLASGYTYVRFGDYRLNPEHPPLIKMLAATPLLVMDIDARRGKAWRDALTSIPAQWDFARDFLYANDTERMFLRARLVVLAFGLLTGALIFVWSYETWGAWGAALSTALFAFDPNFIAHSGLVTTDVGVTALMLAAVYFFWRTCTHRTIGNAVAFAIAFALAQIAKFTAVTLIPIVLVLSVYTILRSQHRKHVAGNLLIAIAAAALAAFIAIWAIFGFRYSASSDGHFNVRQASEAWAAETAGPVTPQILRLAIAANDLHLLPEAYLEGFVVAGGSAAARPSFLNGEFSKSGFDSYFFWTFLYKTPLPAIALMLAGFYVALRMKKYETIFLLWPVTIYLIVALTSSLNIGHRHIMTVFPFIYILSGALASRRAIVAVLAVPVLAISANVVFAGSPAVMTGKHLSYMNEIAGGPRRGYTKLNGSDFDWGQDLERLGQWVRRNNAGQPIHLLYYGTADPRYYGIRDSSETRYVAISTFRYIAGERPPRNARLVDRAGYSILIFRIE